MQAQEQPVHRCFMTTSAKANLRQMRERTIRSHMEAECNHDIAATLATFADTTIRGSHAGTWAGVPASGQPIEVRCGCVFHFEDDRLVKKTVYFDHATLLAQIGVNG